MSKEKNDTFVNMERFKLEVDLFETYIEVLRNNQIILKEQLSVRKELHNQESQKVKRYEDTFYALLHIATQNKQDNLSDILLNTLRGLPLEEKLKEEKDAGKIIWKSFKQNSK